MKRLNILLAFLLAFTFVSVNAQVEDSKSTSTDKEKTVETPSCLHSCTAAKAELPKMVVKSNEKLVVLKADIHCDNCKGKAEKGMAYVKGVKDVKADVASRSVSIVYDPKKTNEETLLEEFKKLDLGGEIMKQGCGNNCGNSCSHHK